MIKLEDFFQILMINIKTGFYSWKKSPNYDQLDINKFLISIPHIIDETMFSKTFEERINKINC